MAVLLDMPDVDYSAVAPGAAVRTPLGDSAALFAALDGLLVLGTGGIQDNASYGPATVYGVDVQAGVDVALSRQLGLRVALAFSQINLSFNGKGALALTRDADSTTIDVSGATDRLIDLTATLGYAF